MDIDCIDIKKSSHLRVFAEQILTLESDIEDRKALCIAAVDVLVKSKATNSLQINQDWRGCSNSVPSSSVSNSYHTVPVELNLRHRCYLTKLITWRTKNGRSSVIQG